MSARVMVIATLALGVACRVSIWRRRRAQVMP